MSNPEEKAKIQNDNADGDVIEIHDSRSTGWVEDLKRILLSKRAGQVLSAVIILVALRVGINYGLHLHHEIPVPTVRVVTPEVKALDSTMTLPGNMEALEQASLFAHVGGYLKKIYVDEGDTVKKGQLLAEIDAPDVVDEYNKVKAEYQFKNVTRQRYLELVKEQVISQQEFDNVDAAYNEALARFNSATANMEYTRIRAPFDGSIARRYKYPGDLISGQAKEQNPIFLLVNEKQLRVVINIPQSEVANVTVGHAVDVQVDSFPGKVFEGTVSRLDALLDEATKTQRVLIDLENSEGRLRAGMYASVVLHLQHKDNAITVPADVVETQGDKNFVYLFKDGKAKKMPVILGTKDGEQIEIVDGVTPGDKVIEHGMLTLADGMSVQALETKNRVPDENH